MAPWTTQCAGPNGEPREPEPIFWQVRDALPGQESVYEHAWDELRIANENQPVGYPSSEAFVRQVWRGHGPYSMLLCETNCDTANEIGEWLCYIGKPPEWLSLGDWRDRFEHRLPNPLDSLTLVSFDPYLYSTHTFADGPKLYREDLDRTLGVLACEGPVIIQLSTYEARNNHQGAVITSVNSVLYSGGFGLAAVVRADKRMMSLVYAHGVNDELATQLAGLPDNFTNWLREVKRRMR